MAGVNKLIIDILPELNRINVFITRHLIIPALGAKGNNRRARPEAGSEV
jgi:hypothetical protein